MKTIKFLFLTFLVAFSFSIFSSKANAYALKGWHIANRLNISYKTDSMPSVYTNAYSHAVSSWNAKGFKFQYFYDSASLLTTYNDSSTTTYGETTSYVSNNTVNRFTTKLNTNAPSISNGTYTKSTACHELGHPLGLGDLSSGQALMSHARDRTKILTPQVDDMNGLRQLYIGI